MMLNLYKHWYENISSFGMPPQIILVIILKYSLSIIASGFNVTRPVSSILVYISSSNTTYYNMQQLKPQLYSDLLFITITNYYLKCIELGTY